MQATVAAMVSGQISVSDRWVALFSMKQAYLINNMEGRYFRLPHDMYF